MSKILYRISVRSQRQPTILLWLIFCCISSTLHSQVVAGDAYLIGAQVEIGIDGDAGHEGAADWPDHNSRGGVTDVIFGFVANPTDDGWVNYNGDYFTAGTPENGFGVEINGRNYSNNAWNQNTTSTHLQEIPKRPGTNITHSQVDSCLTVSWEGMVAGVVINVKYHLVKNKLYYNTEITITNESGSDINDFYYYRNLDADNNEPLTGNFNTTNTIIAQPNDECLKALVSAEQSTPWDSYVGIGSYGENFRVSHGGFSNRSGSDIWNGIGLNSTVGLIETGDFAISLAYKEAILSSGETINFSYAVVLASSQVDASLANLYYVNYETPFVSGGEVNCLERIIVTSCLGAPITLNVEGPAVDEYNWTWSTGDEGESILFYPEGSGPIYVTGVPISPCLSSSITKEIFIELSEGPIIQIEDPGPICEEFSLDTLVMYDVNGGTDITCIFLTEEPDSATQVEPLFPGPVVYPDDEVWLLCRDTITGCYYTQLIDLNFIGIDPAGKDTIMEVCGGFGAIYNLHFILSDTDNSKGRYVDLSGTGKLNDSTGIFNAVTLEGTFEFLYIVDGVGDCPSDTAHYIITVLPNPNALFEYEVAGLSSNDGIASACINDTVFFTNLSWVDPPQYIESFQWSLGEGEFSEELHPWKLYTEDANHSISLVVVSDNGCIDNHSLPIKIFDSPKITPLITDPQCFGFTNGSIEVTTDVNIEFFRVVITDEDRNILSDGPALLEGLGPGTYYIDLYHDRGCNGSDTVTLYEPIELDILLHFANPPCANDSGYVVIDSVTNQSFNNPIYYEWEPNPAGIEGFEADSSYWMKAGDYSVTITDSKGCKQSADITLIDPPPFYFTEWGWDTAYCRLYNYQSGNGIVYAAAAGGVPNYHYEWTYDYDGTTSNNTTWGGRNPGNHTIRVTDAGGCVLTKVIYVDSVNPIASFTMYSTDLNEDCEGTAPVEVEFTNTSQYYANPNNPISDTTFFWDLDRGIEEDWIITHDFYEKFDTIYEANGESYTVNACLIAMNKNGCRDTTCKTITIFEPPIFTPINVFSPDGGGENDYFTFEHFSKGIDEFNCIIVNRWGVQVAEINDIRGHWNGLDYRGVKCTDGVYFYTYLAIADNGTKFEGQGNVTIINSGRK